MSIVARRGKHRPFGPFQRRGASRSVPLPAIEALEVRQLMDAGLGALTNYYQTVLCQVPPASVLTGDDGQASITSAEMPTVHLTPGWATFGQALPRGAAFDGLEVGGLSTQTDVKTRWSDGSIRFAVVSAQVGAEGDYTLAATADGPGSFTQATPSITALFQKDGEWYYAYMPNLAWEDRWLDGPLVQEGRMAASVHHWPSDTEYPHLRVVFDLRTYADGQERLDFTVENTLDAPGGCLERYDFLLFDEDRVVYSRENIEHPYLTRWRQTVDLGLQASSVTSDFEPAIAAGAVPRYMNLVTDDRPWAGGPDFDILGPGSLSRDMEAHGGRPEVAPYPDWAARFLVHGRAEQRDFVLRHGDLAGSWPVHVRELDGQMVSIDLRPNYWLDPRAPEGDRPAGNLWDRNLYDWSTGRGMTPDNAHQPSLAYIPYLTTGDRYYADEMAFWANYVLLSTWQDVFYNARNGSAGILESNQIRGIGWGLRNITDAAAYLPDSDPMKAHFTQKVMNNLAWLDNYANQHQTPLGSMWENRRLENFWDGFNHKTWLGLWEQNYLAWAIDHANKQGFEGGLIHRDRIAQFQLGLFRNPATRDGAAPYLVPVGDQTPAGSQITEFYTDPSQLYAGPCQFQGYYGVDARLMLLVGLENGWDGAQDAYNYLNPQLAEELYVYGVPDLALRAGWAIAPAVTAA